MSEQVGTAKRKPGRPRKVIDQSKEPSVMDIMDMAVAMGMSRQATRRWVNKDPDAPVAFKINGQDHWLREDHVACLKLKAQRAREEKEARQTKQAQGRSKRAA